VCAGLTRSRPAHGRGRASSCDMQNRLKSLPPPAQWREGGRECRPVHPRLGPPGPASITRERGRLCERMDSARTRTTRPSSAQPGVNKNHGRERTGRRTTPFCVSAQSWLATNFSCWRLISLPLVGARRRSNGMIWANPTEWN